MVMTKLGLMVRLAVVLSLGSGAIAFGTLPGIAQEVENRAPSIPQRGRLTNFLTYWCKHRIVSAKSGMVNGLSPGLIESLRLECS